VVKLDDALLDRLSAYVDGELSAAEMTEIEKLIAEDPAIAQKIGDLRTASQAIGEDFLRSVRDKEVPKKWLQLIKEKSSKSSS